MFGLNDEEFTSLIFNIDVNEENEENEEKEEMMDCYGDIYTWDEIDNMQSIIIKSNVKDDEELPF